MKCQKGCNKKMIHKTGTVVCGGIVEYERWICSECRWDSGKLTKPDGKKIELPKDKE